MHKPRIVLSAIVALTLAAPLQAENPRKSVMVGGSTSQKACPSTAKAKSTVIVRTSPGSSENQIDSISDGHVVNFCEVSSDGRWVGIVYQEASKKDRHWDCQVSSPGLRRPYNGPCRSGWVERSQLSQ